MNYLYISISALSMLSMLWCASRRFGAAFTPISFVVMLELGVKVIFSYLVFATLLDGIYEAASMDKALILSTVYYLFYMVGFLLLSKSFFYRFLLKIDNKITSKSIRPSRSSSVNYTAMLFFLSAILCFFGLVSSEGGWLWVTAPREAYGLNRQGVGIFWAGYVNFISLSFLMLIFNYRNAGNLIKIFILGVFGFMLYFSGSKQSILSAAICFFFLRFFYAKERISATQIYLVLAILAIGFLCLTLIQGSYGSISESLGYFDYLLQTSRYLEIRDSIAKENPMAFFSYFWSFIPRSLFPDKPFEYGPVLISSYLFPGAAETGYTPAYLEWALADLQAGFVGVISLGVMKGALVSSAYNLLIKRKNSLFAFLVCCQLGFSVLNLPGYFELAFFMIVLSLFSVRLIQRIKRKSIVRVTIKLRNVAPSPKLSGI